MGIKPQKINISPNETLIAKTVGLDKTYSNILVKFVFFLVWVFGIISIPVIIFYYLEIISISSNLVGLFFVVLALSMAYWAKRAYYFDKLKDPSMVSLKDLEIKPEQIASENIFNLFSFELARATNPLFSSDWSNLTTKDLTLAILQSHDMDFILVRLGIGKNMLEDQLKNYAGEKIISKVVTDAIPIAVAEEHHSIGVGDVFVALCRNDKFLKSVMDDLKLTAKDVANVVYWQTKVFKDKKESYRFLSTEHFKLSGGVGKDWAFGYTPFLKQFSVDITESLERGNLGLEIIGHDKEIEEIKEALLRGNGGNAIIVGEPGIGKETCVLGFAKKVLEGTIGSGLDFKHIVKIETDYLLSGAEGPGEITDRITGIFNEASAAGNIILYIENLQNLLSSGDAGKVNAADVILPLLQSSELHLIGTCDTASYNRYIVTNTALNERITRVTIDEPSDSDLIRILEDTVPTIEYKSGSIISYEAIKEAVSASNKYIMDIPNPEKSITLLDSATAHAVGERGRTIVLPKDILEYVTDKYDIPSGEVDDAEKQKLLSLEKTMHERVIGQSEAISAISNALRRVRAGVTDSKKPIGSFLFLGPTGVGKTETSKALAEAYFGGEGRMIRFDMSEFQNKEDIYRLIGDGEEMGVLTTAVREQPFSLLLFDELEKADKEVLNLFLQMLDEGFITDGSGRKVLFKNTIIIATSNAGANLIREAVKTSADYEKTKESLIEYLQKENIYKPEFLNRFSGIIAFSPLSQDEIMQIASLMIKSLQKTVLKNKGIKLEISPDSITQLSKLGFDPQMGARPMSRVIEEKVENLLATKILSGELKKGDTFTIDASDIK